MTALIHGILANMALQKQKVSLPLAQGLDTKTDDQQKNIGTLDRLENAVFTSLKELKKRNGYSKVQTKLLDGTEITSAKSLTKFDDQELCILTDTNFYAYSETVEKWTSKGALYSAFPSSTPVIRNARSQKNIDAISQENLNVFVYEDQNGIFCTIKDNKTANTLLGNFNISASGTLPKVAAINNSIHVIYVVGTDIRYRKINLIDPTKVEAEQTIASDLNPTEKHYDARGYTDRIAIAYNTTTNISIVGVLSNGALTSTIGLSGENCNGGISLDKDSFDRVIISYSNNSEVKFAIAPLNLAGVLLSPIIIESIADVKNLTTIEQTQNNFKLFYEIPAASKKDYYIKKVEISFDGTVGTPEEVVRSVGLATKVFKYQDVVYLTVLHESQFQSTYYIVDENGMILSQISPLNAGAIPTENGLPKVTEQVEGEFLIATQVKGRTVTDEGAFFSLLGVNSTVLDFEIQNPYQNAQLGKNLHIAGGVLKAYDGTVINEHGFLLFPEDLQAGASATTGGQLQDGDYQYAAVYSWTDAYGQIHRSAPSIGLDVTLSGGGPAQTQEIIVPTLRLTEKEDVVIELYRTEANGTIFYKITEVSNPVLNDKTVNTITIADDSVSDEDLISKEILYTTGGFLDNIPAPSSTLITSFNDRIFLAGLEDKNKIAFSKITESGEPVEFNDSLFKTVNSEGGGISALGVLDDKLIIFKSDSIFYMSGDGPNDLGQQDTYIEPERISSEIGCTQPNSIVLTPAGLMFKSRKGIYLLTPSLGIAYVGAPVEEFNDLQVTSTDVVPEDNQVRFITSDGNCLVFNYFTQQWATFDNHRGLSSVVVNNDFYYLRNDGVIYKEANESFTDNGSSVNMVLESGWLSFASVQGYQRVYKLFLLGKFFSKHKIRIRIAYNFKDAFIHEEVIDTADFIDDKRYGDDSPYGEGVYGGDSNIHQIRLDLKIQKCQSIKIRIEEIQDQELGEGLSLSNILFQVGVKKGTNKQDVNQQYGTKNA